MKYKLSDAITIIDNDSEYVFLNERKKVSITKDGEFEKLMGEAIRASIEIDEIHENKISVLIKNKFFIPENNFEDNCDFCNLGYFEYFCDNPLSVLYNLKQKMIMVVGLGGVGQCVIQHLVACGFRKFILIDFDVVQKNNMNRQFLSLKNNIGHYKTDVIENYLKSNFNDISVSKFNMKIEDEKKFIKKIKVTAPDMIVCAADTPPDKIKMLVSERAQSCSVPCAFASVGVHIGEVGPILTKDSNKEMYIKTIHKKRSYKIIYNPILKGSICFTNTIISVMLARDIMLFFTEIDIPETLNQSVFYDLKDMKKLKICSYKK